MDKHELIKSMIGQPKNYYYSQKKDLEKRLNEVIIPSAEEKDIKREQVANIAKDKALAMLRPFGGVISTILEWNDGVNEEMEKDLKDLKTVLKWGLGFAASVLIPFILFVLSYIFV